jgi:hypothetical protein
LEDLDCGLHDPAESSGHSTSEDDGGDPTLCHGLLSPGRECPPNVPSKRWQGLEVALVGRLHVAGDSILGSPELAPHEPFSQRFKGDIFEPKALKKLGGRTVYRL